MSTDYHDPLVDGTPTDAATLEAPLAQLDAAISAVTGTSSAAWAVVLSSQAASGQKVLLCNAPASVAAGQSIMIGDPASATVENRVVDTTVAGVSITVTVNLTSTHAAGETVANSGAEIVQARGGEATLWTGLRKTAGVVAASFPGSPVNLDICIRSDRGYAAYRYIAAAWVQMTVPSVAAFWATPSTNDRCFLTAAVAGYTALTEYTYTGAAWVRVSTPPVQENFLTGDVTMTNGNQFYDGPSLSLDPGTYLLIGHVSLKNATAGGPGWCTAKLWDGTNVFDTGDDYSASTGTGPQITLTAVITLTTTTTVKVSAAQQVAGGVMRKTAETNGVANKNAHLLAIRIGG